MSAPKSITEDLTLKVSGVVIMILLSIIAYLQKEQNDFAKQTYSKVNSVVLSDTLQNREIKQLHDFDVVLTGEDVHLQKQLTTHDSVLHKHGWIR